MNNFIPTVIENDGRGEKAYDVYSRMLKDRIIWVRGVDEDSVNAINSQLLFLLGDDDQKPIKMYINSPGGSILDGDSVLDTMDFIKSKGIIIETMVIGKAASFGALILLNGSKGYRSVLPRSRVMIHQPLGGAQGQASDIALKAELIIKMKNEINYFISETTGQPLDVIESKTDRDTWFRGQEAVDFGLADKVINTKVKVK
ncbi:head maturation protease [Bacillus phage G]|uniref:endopeptidase Clp n=1 Tax=Bacillus phage G TaxID=2884420 RepID=G3M9Z8_9CAUD|nr:head maturation protease [Bacillus phage G]AEO93516.1 gp257 [Bacillus phage G]